MNTRLESVQPASAYSVNNTLVHTRPNEEILADAEEELLQCLDDVIQEYGCSFSVPVVYPNVNLPLLIRADVEVTGARLLQMSLSYKFGDRQACKTSEFAVPVSNLKDNMMVIARRAVSELMAEINLVAVIDICVDLGSVVIGEVEFTFTPSPTGGFSLLVSHSPTFIHQYYELQPAGIPNFNSVLNTYQAQAYIAKAALQSLAHAYQLEYVVISDNVNNQRADYLYFQGDTVLTFKDFCLFLEHAHAMRYDHAQIQAKIFESCVNALDVNNLSMNCKAAHEVYTSRFAWKDQVQVLSGGELLIDKPHEEQPLLYRLFGFGKKAQRPCSISEIYAYKAKYLIPGHAYDI